MEYLGQVHHELARSQQSDVMEGFGSLRFDAKIIVIGLSLSAGIFCAGMAWRGTQSDRQYFCLKTPSEELSCSDKNNRPYRMTKWHWQQWQLDGRPKNVVVNKSITTDGIVKADNPHKPFWALGAFACFALAGWKLRHLQDETQRLAVYSTLEEKKLAAIAEMQAQKQLLDEYLELAQKQLELESDLELLASERSTDIQKAEILSATDVEITQMDASDALFEAQTAGMTSDQKQQYIDFIRQQKTPYLQGSQTLQQTIDPNDKVTGNQSTQSLTYNNQQFSSVLQDGENDNVVAEILGRVAREDGSTALCGDPGTGKSTITREYIRQVQVNCQYGDIRVLAIKNDSFCGLREQGKVTRFVGESAIENARTFFRDVQTEYNERLDVLEHERSALPPFVIILDDWLAIAARLNKVKAEDLGFDFGQILFDVLIIGRDYNMKFFVNLHSLNLGAIGIKALDQNTRKCLRLLLLGNRYRKDGRELDAYGVIEQAIMGNQVITHAADKEVVRAKYTLLKEQSRSQFRPVMFAFIGGYYLGLVPQFHEQVNSPPPVQTQPDPFADIATVQLSPRNTTILQIIAAGTQPVSFESIRKSRRWGESTPAREELRSALVELIQFELVEGNEQIGYSVLN